MPALANRLESHPRLAARALLYRTAMRAKILAVVALTASLLAFAAGCAPAGPLAEKCQSACHKQLGCEGRVPGDCVEQCVAVNTRWRAEYSEAYFKCYLKDFSSACTADDSRCSDDALGDVMQRPADQTFSNICFQKASACMYKEFRGDRCGISRAYAQSYLDRAAACLPKACGEVDACLIDAFGG
jgi:hypothetical protein